MKSLIAVLSVLMLLGLAGCPEDDVGIPCMPTSAAIGSDAGTGNSHIELKAMDCISRLCIQYGSGTPLCTKTCGDDDDCPDEADYCPQGFQCIYGSETGKLRCCKMCVCREFISDPSSAYCEANPNSECPSL